MVKHIKVPILLLISSWFCISCREEKVPTPPPPPIVEEPKPVLEYGFDLKHYNVIKDTIKAGDTFGKLLNQGNIGMTTIHTLVQNYKDVLNPKNLRIGQPYARVFSKNNPDTLAYFVYEPSITHFVKIRTKDSLSAESVHRKITYVEKSVGGTIQNNLSQDMINAGVSFTTAHTFSQIFDYTIDFFHLQPNDKFRVIYQERYVDDTIYAGLSKIKAGYFEHKGKPFYAFDFQIDTISKKGGFYDENGNTMKRMFLKAPLDIFRITSRFGMRYHPVLHRMKGHFGTDYAAPHGTPIRATASGTITQTGYTSGNGNFVRIRHNKTYETQYLHMSKILVKQGQFVAQGEIIGRVGSTGLATGPHVCYRFWKNGKQVDPLREALPEAEPMDEKHKIRYIQYITPLKKQLDEIPLVVAKNNEAEIKPMIDSVAIQN